MEKVEEKSINDVNELNDIQNNLVEKSDGKFLKSAKPKDAKYTRMELTRNLAICMLFVYKHYKFGDGVNQTDYFPKRVLLQYLKQFPNITKNFSRLRHWDLIAPMPTSPTEVIYKKGWYGITENGIAWIQKEIAMPKYAFVWDGFAHEHKPIPTMITDLVKEDELNELLKI